MSTPDHEDAALAIPSDPVAGAAPGAIPGSAGGGPGARRLLADRRFRTFWVGQAVSELGDGMTGLALFVLVHRLAGTASAVATLAILTSIPQLLIGLHAGVFVDRWNRRSVMIASDLLRAALVGALVLVRDPGQLAVAYALAVAQAAAAVFFEPARTALLPALVESRGLLAANSLSQTTRITCTTLGAALAGILLAMPNGMAIVFGLDALTFVVSAGTLARLRVEARAADTSGEPRGVAAELAGGLRLLFRSPVLVALLLVFAITMVGMGAVSVLFVPFMVGELGGSTAWLGLARASQVAGMLVGGALLAGPAAGIPPARVLTIGILGMGPCLALLGMAPHPFAVLPVLALVGMGSSGIQAGSTALLQHAVPDRARGRVESALDTLLTAVMMVGMAAAGGAADRFGARMVFVGAGLLAVIAGLAGRAALGRARDGRVEINA